MSLKGKPIAGDDDIPEMLVKQCMQLIKEPLVHIYNLSLNGGYLSRYMEDSKSKTFIQKGK
jgi:hypothetical protein